jgi:hypothetical protein
LNFEWVQRHKDQEDAGKGGEIQAQNTSGRGSWFTFEVGTPDQ